MKTEMFCVHRQSTLFFIFSVIAFNLIRFFPQLFFYSLKSLLYKVRSKSLVIRRFYVLLQWFETQTLIIVRLKTIRICKKKKKITSHSQPRLQFIFRISQLFKMKLELQIWWINQYYERHMNGILCDQINFQLI